MRLTASIVLAASLLASSVQAGMYGQPVLNLDAKTFKQVMATEHAAMVAFVAPWCGHCKNLGPEFTAAASSLSPLIPFYAVDCDDNANKGLCGEYQIQGFPTIKAFPRAGKGAAKDYNGERKKGALIEYAKTLVPDRVKKLRVDKEGKEEGVIKSFLKEKSELPHVLLVHPSAPSIPFLWKVLGHRLSSKMHLGYIRDTTSHTVLSSLGIFDSADTTRDGTRVVSWPAGASSKDGLVEYEGGLKFNALLEWLQDQLEGKTPSDKTPKQKPLKASESNSGSSSENKTESGSEAGSGTKKSDAKAQDAAARRAKMDEAERRDKERRERAAEKAAAEAQAQAQSSEQEQEQEQEVPEEAVGASPVEDAPQAVPEESVSEQSGAADASGSDVAAPAAEQAPLTGDIGSEGEVEVEAENTERIHEEL